MPVEYTPADTLLTIEEVAGSLKLAQETVREMARQGRLPGHKVGKVWRFAARELDAFVKGGEGAPDTVREPPASLSYTLSLDLEPAAPSAVHTAPVAAFRDPAFTENRDATIHRWVPWIAGFSSSFVSDCLDKYLPTQCVGPITVLDPFAGVGTTLVEAARRGHNTLGFEVNPYPALASRAKLEAITVNTGALEFWINAMQTAVNDAVLKNATPLLQAPAEFRSRIPFFSPDVERQVLLVLSFVKGIADQAVRDMFLIAFGSVMVKFSNYSYEPSLGSRPASGKPLIEQADVVGILVAKMRDMLQDCKIVQQQTELPSNQIRQVIADSYFNASYYVNPATVDLMVTSPPYLNDYHYIRNTRPHLFWLDLVTETSDLKNIEHSSFGKYWQTVREASPMSLEFAMPALDEIIRQLRLANPGKGVYGGNGWANYAVQYFNDTFKFCAQSSELLKPGGCAVIVVGNSILQGIEIKVDEFLGEIGERHDLVFEANCMLRTKRVGNSIVRSSVRNGNGTNASLYEVAVVLRKPVK